MTAAETHQPQPQQARQSETSRPRQDEAGASALDGPVDFASGVNIEPVTVAGWDAWALSDRWPNQAGTRTIAFLDEEALRRIHRQAAAALLELDADRT